MSRQTCYPKRPNPDQHKIHRQLSRISYSLLLSTYVHTHFRNGSHENTNDNRDKTRVRGQRESRTVHHVSQHHIEKRLRRFTCLCNGHWHDIIAPVRQCLGQNREETKWYNPHDVTHASSLHAPSSRICRGAWECQHQDYINIHTHIHKARERSLR